MGDYVLCQATQSFKPPPDDKSSIEFIKDDIIKIRADNYFSNNSDKLRRRFWAYNLRTEATGYVPGMCICFPFLNLYNNPVSIF